MPVSVRKDDTSRTRRGELAVSSSAPSGVPWKTAGAAGVTITGADLLLHLIAGHLALTSSLATGSAAFFVVAGAGLMLRNRNGRVAGWARRNPWQFAAVPAIATAAVVFVLAFVVGSSGLFGGAFTALWHAAVVFGLTGVTGAISTRRRPAR